MGYIVSLEAQNGHDLKVVDLQIHRYLGRQRNPCAPDIPAIRAKYGLSQAQLASLLGISLITVKKWEQGSRKPEVLAAVVLNLLDSHPEALLASMYPPG